MITIRKLQGLKAGTRHRQAVSVLGRLEADMARGSGIDVGYLRDLLKALSEDPDLPEVERHSLGQQSRALGAANGDPDRLIRICNSSRHALQRVLGVEPAEWDLISRSVSEGSVHGRTFPIRVYLDDIRSPFNVGSVFRTAAAFGVERVILSPDTPLPTSPRARRSSMGCVDKVAWRVGSPEELGQAHGLFALEHGGIAVDHFHFPSDGTVVIGNEELGVSPEALSLADSRFGRATVPTPGVKSSLNVSVAFGILMHHWTLFLQNEPISR